jgi:hypothetical protein
MSARESLFLRRPVGLRQHVWVDVEAHHLLEEVSETQRHDSWATADIQQAAATVEPQHLCERIREARGVGKAAAYVVRRGATEGPIVRLGGGHLVNATPTNRRSEPAAGLAQTLLSLLVSLPDRNGRAALIAQASTVSSASSGPRRRKKA